MQTSLQNSTIDTKYIPTTDDLLRAWLSSHVFANVPEKIEYEVGFEEWLLSIRAEAWEQGFIDGKALAFLKNAPDRDTSFHRYSRNVDKQRADRSIT